jgi:lipopolysaccharide heptosyltransferase II
MTERILIVRLAALGDIVMTSVLLSRIRVERPDAEVTWLCAASMRPLVELFDGVHHIVVVDEQKLFHGNSVDKMREVTRVWGQLGKTKFDQVLIAHADRRYRALVPTIDGVRMLDREIGQMNPISGRYLGDEYARLLDPPGNRGPLKMRYSPVDVRQRLPPASSDSENPTVVLVPGGARNVLRESALRRWPVEHYRHLADGLAELNVRTAIVGDGNDEWVRPFFAGSGVVDLLGASISETLASMRDAALVISHDTGPMHLARLVRTPLIALFGPTMPTQFLPADEDAVVFWGGASLPCRPCYDGREFAACSDNRCMKTISVHDVLVRAERLLIERRGSPVPVA